MPAIKSLNKTPIRSLGIWTTTCLVLGNMIGTGVFYIPASLASIGSISIFGWVLTAIGALSLAFIFAHLSHIMPKHGGPYAYTRDNFGDFTGFLVAWGYWTMCWTSNAAVSLAFTSYLAHFFPILAVSKIAATFVTLGFLWFTTLINCFGLRYGGIVQVTTVILKVIPLALVGIFGLFYIDTHNFTPWNISGESNFSAINSAAALTMWAFIGLESATVPTDSVRNPERTIPRATLLGTSLGALIYILTTIVLFGLISPEKLALSHAPFVDAAELLFGSQFSPFVAFCVLASIFGGLNGWVIVQGQLPYALAKDGLFPKQFAQTSANGTPIFGLIICSMMSGIMILASNERFVDQFTLITMVGSVMTLFAYLFAALSAFLILRRQRIQGTTQTISRAFSIAVFIGCFYALWAIVGSGIGILKWVVIGYILGIPLYILTKHQQKTQAIAV